MRFVIGIKVKVVNQTEPSFSPVMYNVQTNKQCCSVMRSYYLLSENIIKSNRALAIAFPHLSRKNKHHQPRCKSGTVFRNKCEVMLIDFSDNKEFSPLRF